jgi:hypothetical protein
VAGDATVYFSIQQVRAPVSCRPGSPVAPRTVLRREPWAARACRNRETINGLLPRGAGVSEIRAATALGGPEAGPPDPRPSGLLVRQLRCSRQCPRRVLNVHTSQPHSSPGPNLHRQPPRRAPGRTGFAVCGTAAAVSVHPAPAESAKTTSLDPVPRKDYPVLRGTALAASQLTRPKSCTPSRPGGRLDVQGLQCGGPRPRFLYIQRTR